MEGGTGRTRRELIGLDHPVQTKAGAGSLAGDRTEARMKVFLLALAGTALLGGCVQETGTASASAQEGRSDCFNANTVDTFSARGDEAVDVRVSANRYYRLELTSFCPNVDWSQRIALRTRGGSSWICRGMDAEIIVPDRGLGPERCLVTRVRRLTDAEVEAARRGD
jgi:hypothetical protein